MQRVVQRILVTGTILSAVAPLALSAAAIGRSDDDDELTCKSDVASHVDYNVADEKEAASSTPEEAADQELAQVLPQSSEWAATTESAETVATVEYRADGLLVARVATVKGEHGWLVSSSTLCSPADGT